MDFFAVCSYLQIDEEASKLAMSDPRFPKPSRIDRFGDIEFDEADIVAFDRSHPNICCFLEEAFNAMAKPKRRKVSK